MHESLWGRLRSQLAFDASLSRGKRGGESMKARFAPRPRARVPGSSPRILLLTSELGRGHARGAEAIQAAVLRHVPAARVAVLDWWTLMNAGVAGSAQDIYLRLVQEHPQLYEEIYHLDESCWRGILSHTKALPPSVSHLSDLIAGLHADPVIPGATGGPYASDRALFALFFAMTGDGRTFVAGGLRAKLALIKWSWARLVGRLAQKIRQFAPDVIVSTQMIPAAMVSYLKQNNGLTLPSIAVPTDFGVHDFWDQPGTDLYCLAHDDMGELPMDLDGSRVVTTGIPLMSRFTCPIHQREARRLLDLRGDGPVVTVLGGGLGLGVEVMTERLLQGRTQTRLLVAAGRNERAVAELGKWADRFPSRVRLFQWTERVDILIRAADLVVAKPGGLTVAEVLACGRPMLAARSLRGQEGFNTRFLLKHQAGLLLEDEHLAGQIDSLFEFPDRLRVLTQQARSLGRRNGAAEIAAHVLERASRGQLVAQHEV